MRLIIALCLIASIATAQKRKSFDIVKLNSMTVTSMILKASVSYNENNIPQDTIYMLLGKDYRYDYLYQLIMIKSGNLNDIYMLAKKCLMAFNESDGTSMDFNNSHISVTHSGGLKAIFVFGEGEDNRGYGRLLQAQAKKLVLKIEQFKAHPSL